MLLMTDPVPYDHKSRYNRCQQQRLIPHFVLFPNPLIIVNARIATAYLTFVIRLAVREAL